ncbi:MAG: TfoX/Sxy family DNA transformation protein [Methanococcaceae archaeon]
MGNKLINIGEVIRNELEEIGIRTLEDLKKTGSAKALFMIHNNSGDGCLNMLYALEGAVKETRWHNLSKEEKEKVRKEYEGLFSNNDCDCQKL